MGVLTKNYLVYIIIQIDFIYNKRLQELRKMILKSVKQGETNQSILEIQIPKADFEAQVNKVFKKQASKISVPGFRKGKAPRAVVEKMYGKRCC